MNRQMRRTAAALNPQVAAAMAAQAQPGPQVGVQVAAPLNDVQATALVAATIMAGGKIIDPDEAVAAAHRLLVLSRMKYGQLVEACQAVGRAEAEAAAAEEKARADAERPKSDIVLIPEG